MITKCMLRAGSSSEVNLASGGSEFSDSSSSVSIDDIVPTTLAVGSLGARSRFLHTSSDTLFNGEPMVTLMEASDDGEDLQGKYIETVHSNLLLG